MPVLPQITLFLQIPILVLLLWLFTAYMARSFPTLTQKRICLLIAHPDDEAMFFAPALLALTAPDLGNQVLVLCLSSGNADGLGHIRKKELVKSALLLGVKSAEHVVVIEDDKLPDSMTEHWNARLISGILTEYFTPKVASTPSKSAPQTSLDVLITFDATGVSGHPNHKSLYAGSLAFLRSVMQRHTGRECPIKLYTLTSINVVRKYSSLLDVAMTVLGCVFQRKDMKGGMPTPLMFVSGPTGYRKAQTAMTAAHRSQMRWFRWGWIGVSRYMVVNDLKRERVS